MENHHEFGTMQEDKKTATKPVVTNSWIIAGLLIFVVFLAITALTVSKVTQGFDASLALSINNMTLGSSLNSLMVIASDYGREYFWIPVVGVMFLFGKRDTKLLAVELAVLLAVGIIAGEVMKYVMFRTRPYETVTGIITRVTLDTDSSYPSGHSLIVSIGAIFSLARFRRKSIALLLTLEAAIVCYSRVYVGMHYPLDVLGGICLGGFIVFTGSFVLERRLKQVVNKATDLAQRILRGELFSF